MYITIQRSGDGYFAVTTQPGNRGQPGIESPALPARGQVQASDRAAGIEAVDSVIDDQRAQAVGGTIAGSTGISLPVTHHINALLDIGQLRRWITVVLVTGTGTKAGQQQGREEDARQFQLLTPRS